MMRVSNSPGQLDGQPGRFPSEISGASVEVVSLSGFKTEPKSESRERSSTFSADVKRVDTKSGSSRRGSLESRRLSSMLPIVRRYLRSFKYTFQLAPDNQLNELAGLNKLQDQRTVLEDAMSMIAVMQFALMVIDVVVLGSRSSLASGIVRSINCFFCALLVLLLYRIYKIRLDAYKLRAAMLPDATIVDLDDFFRFLLEVVVLAYFVPPFINFSAPAVTAFGAMYYYDSNILYVPFFLRLYLVCRTVRNHSRVCSVRGVTLGRFMGVSPSLSFAFRSLLLYRPYMTLLVGFVTSVTVGAFGMLICEAPAFNTIFDRDYGYEDSLWMIFISMTTVGFGDIFPVTYPGRSLLALMIILGLFLTNLFLSVTFRGVEPTSDQFAILNVLKSAQRKEELAYAAARCIQRAWRLRGSEKGKKAARREILRWRRVRRRCIQAAYAEDSEVTLPAIQQRMEGIEKQLEEIKGLLGAPPEPSSPKPRGW